MLSASGLFQPASCKQIANSQAVFLPIISRLLRSRSAQYPTDWADIGTDPTVGGTGAVYRDVRPQVSDPFRPSKRATSISYGGGGGAPNREPYFQPKPPNIRYNPHMYDGGLLPRLGHTDEPVRLPDFRPRDFWAPHRAHFGQNDYIDILGDGTLTPHDFYTGPPWALGCRNEYQRVCARLNNPAYVAWMEEFEPSRLHLQRKRHFFLYKRVNRRKNITFQRYRDAP